MTEDCECRKKPEPSKCWPNDPDYLDGKTEIELPSERFTKAFWDADILDLDDKNKHDTILGTQELFKVRFRVELHGRLWKCMTGDWYFDVWIHPHRARRKLLPVLASPSRQLRGQGAARWPHPDASTSNPTARAHRPRAMCGLRGGSRPRW